MLVIEKLAIGPGQFSHKFHPGRISVFLGNNGAGKSTFTRLITGLSTVNQGEILLNDSNITHAPVRTRDIALVFQEFVNYPSMNCYENIASPLRAQRTPEAVVRREVEALAETLKLSEFLERMPEALSGGQQQRLAIARALAKKASVLLLDEPLVNLDYKLRESLLIELKQLLHERNCIVIYTSSDTAEAFAVADELLLFENGNILQSGDPIQLMNHPVSLAAADLMADPGINSVQAQLQQDTLQMESGHSGLSTYAVRPDHLHLHPESEGEICIRAVTLFSENNGSDTFLHMQLPLGQNKTGIEPVWVAHLSGHHDFKPGENINMYVAVQDLKKF